MAQISFDTQQDTPQDKISLDTGSGPAPVNIPPEVADTRARKAEFGLSPAIGVDKQTTLDAIQSGSENTARLAAALAVDRRKSDARAQVVQGLASMQQGSLSQDQLKFINDKYAVADFLGQQPPTDPRSVFEEYYAGEYLKPMYDVSDQFNHGSFMPNAQRVAPEEVKQIKDTSVSLTEAREIIKTRLEETKAKAQDQSWFSRGLDFGKELIPGYSEQLLKGGWSQILNGPGRGADLRRQARELWALPRDQLISTFNAKMDSLEKKDPALAVEYGEHMLGFSLDREHLDNLFTAVELSPYGGAAGKIVGKPILKGIGTAIGMKLGELGGPLAGTAEDVAAKSAARIAAFKAAAQQQTAQAAKDVVKSTEDPGVSAAYLAGQHYGEALKRIDTSLQAWHDLFKRVAKADIGDMGIVNEGLRSQRLDQIVEHINALERERKDQHDWYVGRVVDGNYDFTIHTGVPKDPAVTAAAGRGDLKTAAIESTAKQIQETVSGTGNPAKNAIEALTDSIRVNTEREVADVGHGGQEIANRLLEGGTAFIQRIQNAAKNIMRVQRLPGILANKEALKAIVEYTKDLYPGIRNSILNISNPILNKDLNTYTQKMIFGRATGEYFQSEEEAKGFAQFNGLTGIVNSKGIPEDTAKIEANLKTLEKMRQASVNARQDTTSIDQQIATAKQQLKGGIAKQQGLGYYLEVERPLDETMHPIRDWLIKTNNAETPHGWLRSALAWLRSPEDTLSVEQNMQRHLAVYNSAPFMTFAKESLQDIRNLAGLKNAKNLYKDWNEWKRAIEFTRDDLDPVTKEQGYWKATGQEVDDMWLRNFGHLPTNTQKAAYFQFKRINEYDHTLRSMGVYRNKMRVGTEGHRLTVYDKDGNPIKSDWFDGVRMSRFPNQDQTGPKKIPGGTGTVLIADREGKRLYAANAIPQNIRDDLTEGITTGRLTAIELFDPESRPLANFHNTGDARVRYVIVRNSESRPINVADQLPRRGGVHFDYDYDNYIKQAKMRFDEASGTNWYEGDTTVMPISIRAMGRDVIDKLNQVRELIKEGKIDEAKAFATSPQGIPAIPWDEHLGWYMPTKGPDGRVVPPRLSKTEPFHIVSKGKMIDDIDNNLQKRYGDSFADGTTAGSLARQNQIEYTGMRDSTDIMKTITDVGTKGNPIYKYEPAQFVDPITTMNRALSRIVNSTMLDDYKIYSVESWIQEAKNWLDTGQRDLSDITKSPFYWFNHPEWKKDMPQEVKRVLESNRLKIGKLVGIPSTNDTFLHSMQQALHDSIYTKLGPRAAELTPSWLLPSLKDPTKFLRSIVFNEKMGLFSVPQFFVHAMTFANVLGIAGVKNGTTGAMAALLHGWAAVNKDPAIIDSLDRIASGLGMKPGFFKEAHELSQRTGFMDVAGEHVFLDAPMANKIIQNKGASFLDAGQIFFRGGVKSLRAGSWYTAVKEFRDLHPTGAFTDDDLKWILNRADLLSHNMSRASTSVLTTGIMSIPAQFYTYQLRLMELMLGKRLTVSEKARLFGVNAVLFGAPVASGLVGTSILGDNLRSYAHANGYNTGDGFYSDLLMNGLPAALENVVFGTEHNIGERYGAKGAEPITDIAEGDKSFLEIFGGASLNSLSNTVAQTSGLFRVIMSGIRGDGEAFGSITPDDLMGPFKEITSVNSAFRIIAAVRFGNYLSKNNAVLGPNSPMQSVFEAATGLTEQKNADMWSKSQDLKANKAYENKVFSMFQSKFTLGMQEANNHNYDQSAAYFKEAFGILHGLGYPEDKIPEAVHLALQSNEKNLVDRTNFNYFLKKILPSQIGR